MPGHVARQSSDASYACNRASCGPAEGRSIPLEVTKKRKQVNNCPVTSVLMRLSGGGFNFLELR
jgi:hypothetical protein